MPNIIRLGTFLSLLVTVTSVVMIFGLQSALGQSVEEWASIYNGPDNGPDVANAIVADDSGNVYVTGYSGPLGAGPGPDIVTIKYNTIGEPQWTERYNGTLNEPDASFAITMDGSGSIYACGYTFNGWSWEPGTTGNDFVTIK